MSQRTLSIIKPDAVAKGHVGEIIHALEQNGLKPIAIKRARLTPEQARGFYHVHRERPFFNSLVEFMCSGPVVLMILEGDDAIARYRSLMGATDPAKAEEGTLRQRFAGSIERNAVHGSDAPETAAFECGYFFSSLEISAD